MRFFLVEYFGEKGMQKFDCLAEYLEFMDPERVHLKKQ